MNTPPHTHTTGIPVVVLFVYKEHSVAQIWNYIELL